MAKMKEDSESERKPSTSRRVSFHANVVPGEEGEGILKALIVAANVSKSRKASKLRSTSFSSGHDEHARKKERDYQKRQ